MFSSWGRKPQCCWKKPETRCFAVYRWSHAQKCTSTCTWNRLKPTKMSWSYLKPSIIPPAFWGFSFLRFFPWKLPSICCFSHESPRFLQGQAATAVVVLSGTFRPKISVTWDDGFEGFKGEVWKYLSSSWNPWKLVVGRWHLSFFGMTHVQKLR